MVLYYSDCVLRSGDLTHSGIWLKQGHQVTGFLHWKVTHFLFVINKILWEVTLKLCKYPILSKLFIHSFVHSYQFRFKDYYFNSLIIYSLRNLLSLLILLLKLASGSFFKLTSMSFCDGPIILCVLPYFLVQPDALASTFTFTFPSPALGFSVFPAICWKQWVHTDIASADQTS